MKNLSDNLEWTVYDDEKENVKLVYTDSWEKAILKAAELGVIPRNFRDVRPRTGDAERASKKEFNAFMEEKF